MGEKVEQLLKQQVIDEFHEQNLDDFIAFFLAKYPSYPVTELSVTKVDTKYVSIYGIPFLASYLRYSDIHLLGSGMRDSAVKEKLCFLHLHVGTILPTYRKFIWEDEITLEDLNRWLPLLCDWSLKNCIMKSTKFSSDFKHFLDMCLDENSFEFQNLKLLKELFPHTKIEIEDLARNYFQMSFYKLLMIIKKSGIELSYTELMVKFYKIEGLLQLIKIEEISKYQFVIVEYLREPSTYAPNVKNMEDFEVFSQQKEGAHQQFLESEYQISRLKWFYCKLFLGMENSKFESIFPRIPPNESAWYQLLQELYQARFPLSLKENLYQKFLEFGDLMPYLETYSDENDDMEELYSTSLFPYIAPEQSVTVMNSANFTILTLPLETYKQIKPETNVKVDLLRECYFPYQSSCLVGVEARNIIVGSKHHCYVRAEDISAKYLVAYDIVTFEQLDIRNQTGLPIVVIDTEAYTKRAVNHLSEMFAAFNWEDYLEGKRSLFQSLKNHPWLMAKYFNMENLYWDVSKMQEWLDEWLTSKLPTAFLKKQLQILEKLLSLNEELELHFIESKEHQKPFQYRKKMIQYEQLV